MAVRLEVGWAPESSPILYQCTPRLTTSPTKHPRRLGIQPVSHTNLQAGECWSPYWKETNEVPSINDSRLQDDPWAALCHSWNGTSWGPNEDRAGLSGFPTAGSGASNHFLSSLGPEKGQPKTPVTLPITIPSVRGFEWTGYDAGHQDCGVPCPAPAEGTSWPLSW